MIQRKICGLDSKFVRINQKECRKARFSVEAMQRRTRNPEIIYVPT